MTDQSVTPESRRRSPRRSLMRTVLALTVAALVAAWLPFTVMYVSAVHRPAPLVSTVTTQSGHPVITTRTSGGQVVASSPGQTAQPVTPVTTRVS